MSTKEITIDFLICLTNGEYVCRSKVNKRFRKNHLCALSLDTRKTAEEMIRLRYRNGKVVKRICSLEV